LEYIFKAITFNLRRDLRLDGLNRWYFRREYAAEILNSSGAIVGGVQELLPHMRDYLEYRMRDYRFIGRGRGRRNNNEHSDVIIRRDAVIEEDSHTFWLSKTPDSEGSRILFTLFPRICTAARVYLKEAGRSIYVLNTHFDFMSLRVREREAAIICSYISEIMKIERLPLIMTGDFNTDISSEPLSMICQNEAQPLKCARISDGGTLHFFKGAKNGMCCDYIFVSDDFSIKNVYADRRSFNNRYPSDHYPVIAELGLDCYEKNDDYLPLDD